MDKLDLLLVPIAFLLQTTFLLLHFFAPPLEQYYDYWLNPYYSHLVLSHTLSCFVHLGLQIGMILLHLLYYLILLPQLLLYKTPCCTELSIGLLFVPCFLWARYKDTNSCSILDMIKDPHNVCGNQPHRAAAVA